MSRRRAIDKLNDAGNGAVRLDVTMPRGYAARIARRCHDRGISVSEALRQFVDAADELSAYRIHQAMRQELAAMKTRVATLRLSIPRASPAAAELAGLDESIAKLAGLAALLPR